MKILVVDDEQIMLDSICLILSKEPELQIEVAHTGREAIEKAENYRPELVMMDLKMPGINGLEALAEIRRLDPHAILIILTAYENFTYAQEAIRLNVYDYLVKPINKTRLLELIAKVKQRLTELRETRQEELALRERYNKLFPFIENEFIYGLMNGIDDADLAEYQELLGMEFNRGLFMAVSYRNKTGVEVDTLIELGFAIRQKMANLAEKIRHFIPCLVAPVKTNPFAIFIPMSPGLESAAWEPVAVARKILNLLQNESMIGDVHIGIGRTYSASSELKRSYQESLLALNYCGQSPVFHYDDFQAQEEQNWESKFDQEIQDILEAIRFGNIDKVEMQSAQLFSKYTHLQGEQDRLFIYLLEFLLAAYWIVKDSKNVHTNLPSFEQIIAIFNAKTDLAEIFKEIQQRIIVLTSIMKEGRSSQVKLIIRQAKEIIDHQFTAPLNLEDISHTIGISPFYFSRLFGEEMGLSFSEYVTKLRMEKAVSMLAQGVSIKECCFSVGYNDPNYFSRIFRKYYDMTPSEYRDEQAQLKGER
jgi:Response regulator containing CheY-like receiver domain and AraC-type DNA-binding domain